ncbi:hypothetical protein PVAND_000589 [Polypedilum vanderplanki]|uniref:G-protein coupled receptors family 1 profile domain-containing protein n=1 Tax=Polypedilum vanderplanki TaxID=319348 RepID=A0A9J6BK96_POLVA|nr:hypothetical protein PVAND_000589 [Polypedilum vanderplanki]
MTVICVLYILIGLKLRKSKLLYDNKGKGCDSQRCIKGQTRVVRMLIAVAVSFFLCFAPFHSQRIMAVYGKVMKKSFNSDDTFMKVYIALTYLSGISYFLSTCINPFLYNLMSHKFRNASKLTLVVHCLSRTPSTKKNQLGNNYSALSLKFSPLDAARMTSVNRDHYIASGNNSSSDIIEIKEGIGSIDEVRNFRTTNGVPYLMENHHPYHSVVRFEPMNFSFSQQTTTTTISRDNSLKNNNHHHNDNSKLNSIAKKLKKCTQKALFKANAGDEKVTIPNGNVSHFGLLPVSSSSVIVVDRNSLSLREVDEENAESPRVIMMNDDEFNLGQHFYGSNSNS